MVECIKLFFNKLGIEWNGFIKTNNHKAFREANIQDFEKTKMCSFLVNKKELGEFLIIAEVDELNFNIYSISLKDELSEITKDMSKEWIELQLKTKGLIFATRLKKKCAEQRENIKSEHEKKKKQLQDKIEHLKQRLDYKDKEMKEELLKIDFIENLTNDIV